MNKIFIALAISVMALVQPAFAEERGTQEEARAMALKAAAYVQEHGREAAAEAFMTDSEWRDRDLYVYMYDADGVVLALAPAPELVGTNRSELQTYGGKYVVREMLALETEDWVHYLYNNPVTQQVESKAGYTIPMDGGGFVGVGAYEE